MATARNVSLTDHLNRFIDREVELGRHQNASEVVREALRRYEREVAGEEARIACLRSLADEGRAAIANGDFVTLRTEEDISRLLDALSDEAVRAAQARTTTAPGG